MVLAQLLTYRLDIPQEGRLAVAFPGAPELGGTLDNRQGEAGWSPDGRAVLFTAQERGSVHLYRLPIAGGGPQKVADLDGSVGSFSVARNGDVAYSYASPSGMSELFLKAGGATTPGSASTCGAGSRSSGR